MVEILVSSWEGLFSGAMLVSGRLVVKHTTKNQHFVELPAGHVIFKVVSVNFLAFC